MHPSDAGLEVVDAEGPGVVVAVPAHHVEGVVRHDHLHEPVAALHHDRELAGLVVGREALRAPDVALREGRHLGELAVLVAVPLRRAHVAGALDHEEPDGRRAQPPAVQHPAGNDDVVARPVGEIAEGRLEDALALHHEDDLVALPVAVEERVLLPRARHRDRDVGVEEERHAVEHRARPGGEARGAEVPVAHHALRLRHPAESPDRPHALDRGGQAQVIEQRRGAGEALVADELLVVERAVFLAERDVSLAGHAPQLLVDGHGLSGCGSSHSSPPAPSRVTFLAAIRHLPPAAHQAVGADAPEGGRPFGGRVMREQAARGARARIPQPPPQEGTGHARLVRGPRWWSSLLRSRARVRAGADGVGQGRRAWCGTSPGVSFQAPP